VQYQELDVIRKFPFEQIMEYAITQSFHCGGNY
jgi:hypothetical protein